MPVHGIFRSSHPMTTHATTATNKSTQTIHVAVNFFLRSFYSYLNYIIPCEFAASFIRKKYPRYIDQCSQHSSGRSVASPPILQRSVAGWFHCIVLHKPIFQQPGSQFEATELNIGYSTAQYFISPYCNNSLVASFELQTPELNVGQIELVLKINQQSNKC